MKNITQKTGGSGRMINKLLTGVAVAATLAVIGIPAAAQQAGAVNGRVMASDGSALAGVTVEATSPVLPTPRTTTTSASGRYQFPLLPPGRYTLTFRNSNGDVIKRQTAVLLQQKIRVDVAFQDAKDEVVVTAQKMNLDTGAASLKNSINSEVVNGVPVGQEYRDILRLIPGVQYTENAVRGPSAGGSGQDNIYQFDGVDVSLPLFGTLSAEPSSHDIDQVSIVRGGAQAIGFNRTGGFLVNTTSKRGTNEFHGEVGYRVQTSGLTGAQDTGTSVVKSETDLAWLTANIGGPILKDKLFFYGSYYRPTVDRKNQSNVYGDVPDFKSTRDEFFGKLTFAPTASLLLDLSYRTSDRSSRNSGVGGFSHPSLSTGSDASQDILIAEGSWIIDDDSSLSFKYTDYENKTSSRPDTLFNFDIRQGDPLNINALDQQGRLSVPTLLSGNAAQNAFVQPFIDQYGYLENGVRQGGGAVGGATTINNQDFFRENIEFAYNRTFEFGDMVHDFHIGYQYQDIKEDLARLSNGYGSITIPAGTTTATDGITPVYFQARLSQMSILGANGSTLVPDSIISSSTLQSFEINDTIEKGDFTFDIGVVVSKDVLYGQGLKENSASLSGFELAPGNKYKMHTVDWGDMIQPRLGIRWDRDEQNSFYANFARYNPPASSLARAASWDRNLRRDIRINFDQNGNFIDIDPVRSSSGKLFQDGIKPRYINEYLVGWDRIVNDNLNVRLHARHKHGARFWEDTNNNARTRFEAPADIAALGDYIPNLNDLRFGGQFPIGGSSYVIAQLDGAHTEYYEAGIEAEYTNDNFYLKGSYVWSHYYGNFDQDNSTTTNDANVFIGSSLIADGAGRQLWNFKEGDLRGDRRHQFKVYGFYELPWNGRVGAYSILQSGEPWEKWSYEPYSHLTGSRSDTYRFAEPAGSRRSKTQFLLDLNYTQNVRVFNDYTVELRADLFNVFNSQTGYNINPKVHSAGFGLPRSYIRPRRLQLSVKAKF